MRALTLIILACISSVHAADDWSKRAAERVEGLMDNAKSRDDAASTILACTHPTGADATLVSIKASKSLDDGSVSAIFTIKWSGGLSGAHYTTEVTWQFGHRGHVSAKVSADNALIPVASNKKVDKYFDQLFKNMFPNAR